MSAEVKKPSGSCKEPHFSMRKKKKIHQDFCEKTNQCIILNVFVHVKKRKQMINNKTNKQVEKTNRNLETLKI